MPNTNNFFIPGKVSFVIDGNNGSSGKGLLSSYLVKNSDKVKFLVTSNSSNASHTTVSKTEKYDFVFKCLPTGSVYHKKLEAVYICSGASFELETLFKEIEMCGIPKEKVRIHPRASIIQPIDVDYEKGLCDLDGNYYDEDKRTDGTIKTGSTCSGSGTVLAKKTVRNKTLVTAKDCPELKEFLCITEIEILERLALKQSGLFEIGQGFPLSNNYHMFAPNTTSRNVTISAALNDAMLPPTVVGNVAINLRTFPIRINSKKYLSVAETIDSFQKSAHTIDNLPKKYKDERLFTIDETDTEFIIFSKPDTYLTWDEVQHKIVPFKVIDSYSGDFYPDQQEITWDQLTEQCGSATPIMECTTLTKLPRRVSTFSKMNFEEAIVYNQTPCNIFVCVNFSNYVDIEMFGQTQVVTSKFKKWLEEYIFPVTSKFNNVKLSYIGTSQYTEDMISVE